MQDLVQHSGVGDEPLSGGDETVDQDLRFGLVRMRRPDQIHRNVRIKEANR